MKKQGVIFKAMASFLLALAVFLPLSAKAEIAGLYIEPKISYGIQYGALYLASDSMGETESDGFDDSTFGGGLPWDMTCIVSGIILYAWNLNSCGMERPLIRQACRA